MNEHCLERVPRAHELPWEEETVIFVVSDCLQWLCYPLLPPLLFRENKDKRKRQQNRAQDAVPRTGHVGKAAVRKVRLLPALSTAASQKLIYCIAASDC